LKEDQINQKKEKKKGLAVKIRFFSLNLGFNNSNLKILNSWDILVTYLDFGII
jgi:hypothetical protein